MVLCALQVLISEWSFRSLIEEWGFLGANGSFCRNWRMEWKFESTSLWTGLANTFPKEFIRNIPAKLTNCTCIYYGEAYREKELDSSGASINLAELWVLSDRSVSAYFAFYYVSVVVWPGEIAGLRGLRLYVLGAAVGLVGLEPTISPLWAVLMKQEAPTDLSMQSLSGRADRKSRPDPFALSAYSSGPSRGSLASPIQKKLSNAK